MAGSQASPTFGVARSIVVRATRSRLERTAIAGGVLGNVARQGGICNKNTNRERQKAVMGNLHKIHLKIRIRWGVAAGLAAGFALPGDYQSVI